MLSLIGKVCSIRAFVSLLPLSWAIPPSEGVSWQGLWMAEKARSDEIFYKSFLEEFQSKPATLTVTDIVYGAEGLGACSSTRTT